MAIRCPECGFGDNRDDALICENCGFKFLEVVLEEELFFAYEEGKTFIRKDAYIENRGGIEVTVNVRSNVRQLIHPSSLDIGPRSRNRLAVSLNTTDLDPDVPLSGELIISAEGRQDYSVVAPVMFGRPPEAEIQPDIVQLGNVFAGNIFPMQFSVRNKHSGKLEFLGYQGELVGERKFREPRIIKADDWEAIEVPLDLSKQEPGKLETKVTFLFGGGNVTVDVTGDVVAGPKLQGEIRWYTMREGAEGIAGDYSYSREEQHITLDNSTRSPVNIPLGSVPQSVRTQIHFRFGNDSEQDYTASMVIESAGEGVSTGFGEEREERIDMPLPPGQVLNRFIQVEAKEIGEQRAQVHLFYDKTDYGLPELEMAISLYVTEIKNSSKFFGMDLGTTNSCISYHDGVKPRPVMMDNVAGPYEHLKDENSMPYGSIPYLYSFCCFPDVNRPDEYYIGRNAEDLAVYPNSTGVKSVKMRLGTGWFISVGGIRYYARDVAGRILKELVARARDALGVQLRNAIITIPANSSHRKIADTVQAYRHAGIEIDEEKNIIYEPEAATYYYLLGTAEGEKTLKELGDDPYHVLTFDFGGGTLDISIIEIQNKGPDGKTEFKLLRSIGANLGGDDLDWGLRRQAVDRSTVQSEMRDLYSKRMSELSEVLSGPMRSERLTLMRACEQAKIVFSRDDTSSRALGAPSALSSVIIERQEHDSVCQTVIVENARRLVQEAIQKAKPDGSDLHKEDVELVLMAGGSSSIIMVKNMMSSMFGNGIVRSLGQDAKTAVSMGATLFAYETQNPESAYEFSRIKPRTGTRVGYMTSTRLGLRFAEIFDQGTPPGTKSPVKQKTMPASGIYTLVLARNRGRDDRWTDNEAIERMSEQRHTDASGTTINEYFRLTEDGKIQWFINDRRVASIDLLDVPVTESDDLGF